MLLIPISWRLKDSFWEGCWEANLCNNGMKSGMGNDEKRYGRRSECL